MAAWPLRGVVGQPPRRGRGASGPTMAPRVLKSKTVCVRSGVTRKRKTPPVSLRGCIPCLRRDASAFASYDCLTLALGVSPFVLSVLVVFSYRVSQANLSPSYCVLTQRKQPVTNGPSLLLAPQLVRVQVVDLHGHEISQPAKLNRSGSNAAPTPKQA